jgi:hypothetical protein
MTKKLFAILITFMIISCETDTTKETEMLSESRKDTSEIQVDSLPEKILKPDYSDSINFTDSNGWKQGQWIRKWKDKLVENYTYVNDTLNGPYETDHGEGYYKNGQKEGLQFSYYGKKESILMVNYYANGNHIWGGFPAAGRDFVIPIKDFHISIDSTYVKAPYVNGQTWYEGSFCLLPDSMNNGRLLPYRYGVHKVYYMNGNLKAIVDYNKETIQEFDSLGNEKYHTGFENYKTHNLATLGRY